MKVDLEKAAAAFEAEAQGMYDFFKSDAPKSSQTTTTGDALASLAKFKERLEKNLKQLKSMVDTERAAFGVLGPKRTPEEIKEEIARCTEKLRAVREQYEKIERGVDTICAEDINAMFDKLGYDGPEDPSRRVGYSRAVEIDRMIFK